MHYLITGGCGFIGGHLARRLAAAGHSLTVIDDLSTGRRETLPQGVNFLKADITESGIFDKALHGVDGVFHLAAIVSVQRSNEEWLRTHEVNLNGTIALLDAIRRTGKKTPVVYASSAAVYGDSHELPLKESTACSPLSAYGADEYACELHGAVATGVHSIPAIGLRFFNVYGPGQDAASPYSGVISVFMDRMKKNLPVTLFGDGKQSRDFIYVDDIVDGMTASMRRLETQKQRCGVYNLCTGHGTSVNELAQIVAKITGTQSEISHAAARAGDIRESLGSPALAQEGLDFSASTPLEKGLWAVYESVA